MGYTKFTKDKVQELINRYQPKYVIDLGDQMDYEQPLLPAPYIHPFFEKQGVQYVCIDLNGGNGALQIDLSKKLTDNIPQRTFLLCDCGVSEHIGNDKSEFDWECIYNCWLIKHQLTNVTGIIYSENPKTNSWPLHGRQFYTKEFYYGMISLAGYELLDIGEHAACNNFVDGWNVYATLRKISNKFPTIEEFKTLDLRLS